VDIVGSASTELPHVAALIDDVLVPGAESVDDVGVQRVALDHLADAGLLGTPLTAHEQRELAELIARADASTWFCWTQHQTPLRVLSDSTRPEAEALRADLLPGLESGELLAGVAHAHLRRAGSPNPRAERVDDGWIVNGALDWVTSWDIADVVMVMVESGDCVLCFFITAGEVPSAIPGVVVGEPLRLLAMGGTHTRPLEFRQAYIRDEQVVAVLDLAEWQAADSLKTANSNPAIFGIARGAISELDDLARSRNDSTMRALTNSLADQCTDIRARAYAAQDSAASVETRLAIRAEALDHLMRCCIAVVTARSGSAMIRSNPAERRVREALFMQVQAQTAATREAMLVRALDR
jgi:alkylation response protein AidB-like acyl-CoA dehydrogenase